jgi:hypothetical protein
MSGTDIAALEAAYEVAMAGSAVGAHTTAADECVAAIPVLLAIARAAERVWASIDPNTLRGNTANGVHSISVESLYALREALAAFQEQR